MRKFRKIWIYRLENFYEREDSIKVIKKIKFRCLFVVNSFNFRMVEVWWIKLKILDGIVLEKILFEFLMGNESKLFKFKFRGDLGVKFIVIKNEKKIVK